LGVSILIVGVLLGSTPAATAAPLVPPVTVHVADTEAGEVVTIPPGGVPLQTNIGCQCFPAGLAVDGAGDVFVSARSPDGRVLKEAGGTGPFVEVGSGPFDAASMAADQAGDLFISDTGNSRIVELPAGGGPQVTLGQGFNKPWGIALDGAGNIYVADDGNGRVVKMSPDGTDPTTLATGLNFPSGIGVDPDGNVFVTVTDLPAPPAPALPDARVIELHADGSGETTVGQVPSAILDALAVDPTDDVFVTDYPNNRVLEFAAGSTQRQVVSDLLYELPHGIAVAPPVPTPPPVLPETPYLPLLPVAGAVTAGLLIVYRRRHITPTPDGT
jgi:hypothetical protein